MPHFTRKTMLAALDGLPNAEYFAVLDLVGAMATKLMDSGRRGFQEMDARTLSLQLQDCVTKGDPVDVANYCAFLQFKKQKIDLPSAEEILAD